MNTLNNNSLNNDPLITPKIHHKKNILSSHDCADSTLEKTWSAKKQFSKTCQCLSRHIWQYATTDLPSHQWYFVVELSHVSLVHAQLQHQNRNWTVHYLESSLRVWCSSCKPTNQSRPRRWQIVVSGLEVFLRLWSFYVAGLTSIRHPEHCVVLMNFVQKACWPGKFGCWA